MAHSLPALSEFVSLHMFRFIVDGIWRSASLHSAELASGGVVNNVTFVEPKRISLPSDL
jgi:hypothetical protein